MTDAPDPEPERSPDSGLELWRAALDTWGGTARLGLIYLLRAIPAVAAAWMVTMIWLIIR